jgi:hypothetical protein
LSKLNLHSLVMFHSQLKEVLSNCSRQENKNLVTKSVASARYYAHILQNSAVNQF